MCHRYNQCCVGMWFGKIKLQLMVWLIIIKLKISLILNLVLSRVDNMDVQGTCCKGCLCSWKITILVVISTVVNKRTYVLMVQTVKIFCRCDGHVHCYINLKITDK